jgi:hypothetical protein
MSAIRRVSLRLLAPAVAVCLSACGSSDPTVVSVFPIPGDRVASPLTQITFRGLPVRGLGAIVVTGSRSGKHSGRLEADSDGRGGSFVVAKPFAPGEVVTVSTRLDVRGAHKGTWRFSVAKPAGAVPSQPLLPAPRLPGDALSFRSRPDLAPASVEITTASPSAATGDIFVTPQQGPLQNGPMILGPDGNLVWFKPLPKGDMAADLLVQRYRGRPVLTWWQGYSGAGIGVGEDVIDDSSYRRLAVVRAANGLYADLHEFELTPGGTALITAYYPVYWNASAAGGSPRAIVLDSVVQEIDVKTGLVVFQWDSLDHVPLSDTYQRPPKDAGQPFDYFHVNSAEPDGDGSLIISGRNTWAAYKVDASGRTVWTLGGKHSSFTMRSGTRFAFQHDVRRSKRDDQTVTLFDDGAGPPPVHTQSRGLTLKLDPKRKTATLVREDDHSPSLRADFEGNLQPLKDGNQLLGWGQQPYFTEYDAQGQIVFDGRFVDANSSYRTYRFPWTATPTTTPAIAASTSGPTTTVYASWNGATTVASWRALAGESRNQLRVVSTATKQGFETEFPIAAAHYVAVQALDVDGRVLSTSATVAPG